MPKKSSLNSTKLAFDQAHIWHPYTSLTNPLPVYPIVKADGVKLFLDNEQLLIDGMSSWWTAIHGYNVPELNEVANAQLSKMSHVMFGGITHEPAIDLAMKLVEITPEGLDRVFFSDSGSVSVEVAMKMAIQYQQTKKNFNRSKFLTMKGGYHGDTTGAMSVCDPENGMHHLFNQFLPEHIFASHPSVKFGEACKPIHLEELTQLFEERQEEIAAFIIEPIVQGAGGMWFYSADYLKQVRELCNKYDILLIFDEIATGFGRTGELFASEIAATTPDILCVGKALTGGYLSLAATICHENVAHTICSGDAGVMMHGPTFMANPLACAIANKSIELLLNSPWKSRVKNIEKQLQTGLTSIKNHPSVKDVRVLGAIGVVETLQPIDVAKAQQFFVAKGVWIRPFKNLIYIMPPYIISEEELSLLVDAIVGYVVSRN